MRFDRVRLENFKCYGDADLALETGVTVIHGLNGSGKSSLLEACFFALYGARALDTTLDEVVTIGAEAATVELWFTHGGGSYHIERRVRVRDDRATTAKCVLETPDGAYEGARDVRRRVTELLRMDAEAFVNCAYVRQGEVNKLINASPADRQDMLDDLLQLGKLEAYRERASDARLGVKHVLEGKRGELEGLDERIERKEDRDLHATLNSLESDLAAVEDDIERFEDNREQAVTTRDEAAAILEEYEEKRERLAEVNEDIEEVETAIQETERERERLGERVRDRSDAADDERERRRELLAETDLSDPDPETVADRIADLEERDEDLRERLTEHELAVKEREREAESHRETAADLDSRATEKRERASDLESDLAEVRETLAERRAKLADLADEIEARREAFADAPVAVGEATDHWESVVEDLNDQRDRETELELELEREREAIAEAESLLEAGKCPECGQPVEDSPHVEGLADRRERVSDLESELAAVRERRETLADREQAADELVDAETELKRLENDRENLEQLVEERASGLADTETQVEELRSEAEDLAAEAEREREAATEAEADARDHREAIAECNRERGDLEDAIERLETVRESFERQADLEDDIERLREQRANKAELNDERRDRLADLRETRADLREAVDEQAIEQAREERERAREYIEKVDPKLADLREKRDDLQGQIGGVRNEIAELEALREDRADLAATVERLESLYEETERLQGMYGTLRAELRRRNVESLERMLNETFELVYQNDSYSRIELDGEYELTVYQKDGEALDPDQLSGGERALFNLSLRCAIYRLLAEGIEGSAPMPPLILDEPTVFLDAGHVSRLVELVDAMRELGVEQIIVVSHDEELVGAADDLVTVRKDATTNRSTVVREEADPATLAALD